MCRHPGEEGRIVQEMRIETANPLVNCIAALTRKATETYFSATYPNAQLGSKAIERQRNLARDDDRYLQPCENAPVTSYE